MVLFFAKIFPLLGGNTTNAPQLEVKQFGSHSKGKKILITAGVDGDELAGIKAAQKLIEYFTFNPPDTGMINIIPIVNTPGYNAHTSRNPYDDKYPKYIYPGNARGTHSDRLVYELTEKYIKHSHFWIDLHGGAIHEDIVPYVYIFQSAYPEIERLNSRILASSPFEKILLISRGMWQKPRRIDKDRCGYIISESGSRGETHDTDVQRHIELVMRILDIIGMIRHPTQTKISHTIYSHVEEYYAGCDGDWRPCIHAGDRITKGAILGKIIGNSSRSSRTIIARHDGTILTAFTQSSVRRDDMVCCAARP